MYDELNSEDIAEVQAQEDKKKEELRSQQLKEDYRKIVSTPEGERFFKHFLVKGDLLGISMTGNSWTFFKEGSRNLAKIIYNELCEAEPALAAKILTEINWERVNE